jgi:TrmH family RNA methyltransferase
MRSLKDYQKLRMKKYRQEWELCVIEGKRVCEEALLSDWQIEAVFITDSFVNDPSYQKIKKLFARKKITPAILNLSDFKNLAETDTPQGILMVMKIPPAEIPEDITEQVRWLLLLEGIRDPGNLGTIIRTADWFGVPLILSSRDSVDFYNPKVLRSSMGSIFRVRCMELENIYQFLNSLKSKGYTIIGTSPNASETLENKRVNPPLAIVLGSEADGISTNLESSLNTVLKIQKYGRAESLNVAVAAGIVMQHFSGYINNT